ncbi:hypothetical protein TPA0909_07930 [Streptomyces albus]|nr:hypothetical protein TPA0909_07930 [Streptomyces albus]
MNCLPPQAQTPADGGQTAGTPTTSALLASQPNGPAAPSTGRRRGRSAFRAAARAPAGAQARGLSGSAHVVRFKKGPLFAGLNSRDVSRSPQYPDPQKLILAIRFPFSRYAELYPRRGIRNAHRACWAVSRDPNTGPIVHT